MSDERVQWREAETRSRDWVSRARRVTQTRIGDFQILERLGGGGMAEVFLCRRGDEAPVAVKRILPEYARDRAFRRMLIDEARILSRLSHPGIVRIFELGEEGGSPFIVMEHVRGTSLLELLRRLGLHRRRMRATPAAFVVAAICDALDHAHARRDERGRALRIVHRDVNPANVLLTVKGEVKLIDFGIATAVERLHATQAGSIKGKYGYLSPEQAQGAPLDQRSDIFAAGVVLYELLTGHNPLQAETELEALARARSGRLPPPSSFVPDLPSRLERICLRAVAPDPDCRYSRAGQLARALEAHVHEQGFSQPAFAAWLLRVCPPRTAAPSARSWSDARERLAELDTMVTCELRRDRSRRAMVG